MAASTSRPWISLHNQREILAFAEKNPTFGCRKCDLCCDGPITKCFGRLQGIRAVALSPENGLSKSRRGSPENYNLVCSETENHVDGRNSLGKEQELFVRWLRDTWPYFIAHRCSTFIVLISAEIVESPHLDAILKKIGAGRDNGLKNTKTPKDQANWKVPISFSRTQRPSMSQNFSFPSRGCLPMGLKKSFDGKSVKLDSKHSPENDTESEGSVSNGYASSSISRVNNFNSSNAVSSVDAKSNGGGLYA